MSFVADVLFIIQPMLNYVGHNLPRVVTHGSYLRHVWAWVDIWDKFFQQHACDINNNCYYVILLSHDQDSG